MELQDSIDRQYRVQSPSAQSFRLTIPKRFEKITGISSNDVLGIQIDMVDSKCVIDFYENPSDNMIKREVAGSNKLIRIPSSIGGSMRLQRDMVSWKLYKKDGEYVYRVVTSYYPLIISDSSWNKIRSDSFKGSREDSNLSLYVPNDVSDALDWDESTRIGFLIAQKDGKMCIRCQPIDEMQDRVSHTTVQKINKDGNNFRMYFPTDLVSCLGFEDEEFEIYENNGAIAIVKK